MSVRYRPGSWVVVAGPWTTAALLPTVERSQHDLVDALWTAVSASADLPALLEAVLRDGWTRAPYFALVHQVPGEQATVVVRGPARVLARTASGDVSLTGDGVLTWAEQRVDAVLSLQLPGDDDEGRLAEPALPLQAGAVMASAVLWDEAPVAAVPPTESVTAHAPAPVAIPVPAPASPEGAPAGAWAHLFEPTDHQTLAPPDDSLDVDPGHGAEDADDDPDHDHLTLTASAAAALRQPSGPGATSSNGTSRGLVTGVPGSPAAPAGPWRLRLTDGQHVPVRGRVLVGREPRADRVSGADVPRLVPVDSPSGDVSRTHLELHLDARGGLVATDLRSTNGTVVLVGGADPVVLQQGTSASLRPGAVLDLGDGVTIADEQDEP